MKKIVNTAAILSLVLASMSFAISAKDTTILGQDYAKITYCSDLGQLRTWTNDGKVVNAVVMQDINCENKDFMPIGQSESKAYEGIFDGNGKTISGMTLKQTGRGNDNYTGMFGVIGKKAQVKNVIIANSKIDGVSSEYAGILVGLNYGVVTNCQVLSSNTIKATSATDVGGIAGRNGGYGTMDGCVNFANVEGGSEVGGIAGACTGAISNSLNYGNVSGTTAGGITGSIHYRNVESGVTHVPGRIALCQNKGSVTGSSYAGGIAGVNKDGSVNNCRNDGAVSATGWFGVAGGVVAYSYFDGADRYKDGKYKATVANSFNTATVSGDTKGGVVGEVSNPCKEYKHSSCKTYYTYAIVSNSYYDSDKLKNVSAIASNSEGVVNQVSAKPTKDMFANDAFVALLNGGSSYIAWLFDGADYPILNCGSDAGAFKITFIVEGKVVLEGTTEAGKLVETVENPSVAGKTFKVWKDDAGKTFTTAEAQERNYDRSLNYYAVFNELFKITFVTDFGVMLDTMLVEEGSQIFYSRIGDDGKLTETPADYETEEATYKFIKWDRENLGVATKNDTIVGIYEVFQKAFDVKFFVQGEQYGETQKVNINEGAVAPADPVVNGFRFKGWDKDFSKVTANLDVDAILEAVAYVCRDDGEVKCDTIPVPGEFIVPETGSNDSITCVWVDKQNNKEYKAGDVIPVEEFMTITLELVCTVNTFDVKFFAKTEQVGETQKVEYGKSATAPADEEIPVYEGYRFSNWIEGFTRIISDSTINANYIPTVEVCFGAGEFEAKDCKTLDKDSTYDVPELPGDANDIDGFTCTAWTLNGETYEGETFVAAQDMEFNAECHYNSFDVKFFVLNTVVDSQKVAYGDSAKTPADSLVAREGYRFDGWDMAFDNVVEDLEVNAKMIEQVTVCFDDACDTVDVNTVVVAPALDTAESYTCNQWTNVVENALPLWLNAGQSVVVSANMAFKSVCPVNEYTVKFVVFADTVKTDTVEYAKPATAPEDPQVAGLKFRGWDNEFSSVKADLVVNAKFDSIVEVCFGEKCDSVAIGDTTDVPEVPDTESSICSQWKSADALVNPGEKVEVAAGVTYEAVCVLKEFDVKFVVFESMVDSQKVKFGSAATEPVDSLVAREGYRFRGWDKAFDSVTTDLVVNANMVALKEVCVVVADTTVDCDTIPVDTTYIIPNFPESDSLTCTQWSDGENYYEPGDTVNVSDIKGELVAVCSVNKFEVKFIVLDSTVKSDSVEFGSAATAPADSLVAREGYRFDGWDIAFDTVKTDLDVNAKMTKLYNVCFGDSCEWVNPGDTIDVPELPETESTECSAWKVAEALVNPGQKIEISEDMNFEAVCKTRTFDVKFVAFDSVLVDSQKVAYGEAAAEPADSLVPEFQGYRFLDWDADFTAITSDLTVNAMFDTLVKVTISADVGDFKLDSAIYVLKDTTITGLKKIQTIVEIAAGQGHTCLALVDGKTIDSDSLKVSKDIDVTVNCDLDIKYVSFFAFDSLLGTIPVLYGFAADFDAPEFPNKRFVSWDADLSVITENMNVNANYVDIDTVFVMVNGEAIDSVEIAKGDSVSYILPEVKSTDDSTFLGWKVDGKDYDIGDTVVLKYGSEIFADFEEATALHAGRITANFSIHSENGQLQVIGARIGDVMAVFDLQGRVVLQKRVQNSVELVNIANRGSYLVRVGAQTKRVVVR